ncbi:MAG: hypothetical protein OXF68_11500 [Gammaproteobacteria bacterium]|nr:hypothetical protein [Gammaproteobacteria bacterium]
MNKLAMTLAAGILACPAFVSAQADNVCGYNNICELEVQITSGFAHLFVEPGAPLSA